MQQRINDGEGGLFPEYSAPHVLDRVDTVRISAKHDQWLQQEVSAGQLKRDEIYAVALDMYFLNHSVQGPAFEK